MSGIRTWWNSVSGSGRLERAHKHVQSGGHVLRAGGESLIVGAGLGAIDAKLKGGLDQPLGKDGKHHVPIDAALGVGAAIVAVAMAHEEVGTEFRNISATALSIFGYRKGKEFVSEKLKSKEGGGKASATLEAGAASASLTAKTGAASAHGEEDPIIAAARALGG